MCQGLDLKNNYFSLKTNSKIVVSANKTSKISPLPTKYPRIPTIFQLFPPQILTYSPNLTENFTKLLTG